MLICGDNEQLAVSTDSVGFTAAKLLPTAGTYAGKKCQKVVFQVSTDAVYMALDGSVASATIGMELAVNDIGDFRKREIYGYQNIVKIRFIRKTTDAVVKAFFYYEP